MQKKNSRLLALTGKTLDNLLDKCSTNQFFLQIFSRNFYEVFYRQKIFKRQNDNQNYVDELDFENVTRNYYHYDYINPSLPLQGLLTTAACMYLSPAKDKPVAWSC